MSKELKEIAKAYALLNAKKYDGKANAKAVLGQILGNYPEYRDPEKRKIAGQVVGIIIKEIDKMSLEAIDAEIATLPPEFQAQKKPVEKKELPPLHNADHSIIMRLAPFPSGPLHIGNARMVILNDYYVKRYKGKLLLVFDDTIGSEEKSIVPDAYDMIVESLDYLGVKYHKKIYKSDRIDKTYSWCKKAIEQDIAYVCTCPAQEWRDTYKLNKRPCPHREQAIETNLNEWEKMLNGDYEERQAVVRLKIGMDHKDPAMRDPVMMRIAKRSHPRVGTKYIVWPLLEFSWAIDDHLLGITHILRGKDLIKEDNIERWVWEQFNWPILEILHYGLITFGDLKLSKSYSRRMIESGVYRGWDDPRTWSIQSLIKRGTKPDAIREAIMSLSLSMVDIEYDPLNLYAINKKYIDPIAPRYFFVPNPQLLFIRELPHPEMAAHPLIHPEQPEKGKRTIALPISQGTAEVFISDSDVNSLQIGSIVRLKDLCNIKILEKNGSIKAEFSSKAMEDARQINAPIIQWVPHTDNVKIQVLMPNGTLIKGMGESACKNLKVDQIIQFERFGFGKVNQTSPDIVIFFAHK
ncbi:MAG: glutamate--tRNA ligase [Candidatus Helarchaeota archaeon]|nr:glutamate--tRNA ligase [Candidatus Helarchaeota archaeon]